MAKSKTTQELITDMKTQLTALSTKVDYEAIAEIKRIKADLKELEERLASYATQEAVKNIDDKVTNINKNITWIVSLVLGAVVLAVVQLVLRSPK